MNSYLYIMLFCKIYFRSFMSVAEVLLASAIHECFEKIKINIKERKLYTSHDVFNILHSYIIYIF